MIVIRNVKQLQRHKLGMAVLEIMQIRKWKILEFQMYYHTEMLNSRQFDYKQFLFIQPLFDTQKDVFS